MATIEFYAGSNHINNLSGSGLGFYGSTFGASVQVGAFQDKTYITDSTGTSLGAEATNNLWASSTTVKVAGATSGIANTACPNYQATLNVRFTHSTPVRTQNAYAIGYDRSSFNNNPSGVTLMACEVAHPTVSQVNNGSGNTTWTQLYGSGSRLALIASPGTSGFRPNGAGTSDVRHDNYINLSASPDQLGSRLFAFGCQLEYL